MIVTRLRPPVRRWEATFQDLDRVRRQMEAFVDSMSGTGREHSFGVFPPVNVSQDQDNFYGVSSYRGSTRRTST